MELDITAVVCTHNRAESLAETLSSLCCQSLARNRYEILVINNASTDRTTINIDEYISHQREITIRRYEEPRLGLSYARNTAYQQAFGDIIAYIDDDAIADEHWLEVLVARMQANTQIWAAGGKVEPIWDGVRPNWLEDDLLNAVSLLDRGVQEYFLKWPERLIGTNVAFRKEALLDTGGFDSSLGRQGNRLGSEEETDIQQRIYQKGGKILYIPSAVVYHHVIPERLTMRYFYARSYGTGQSRAILACRQQNWIGRTWLLIRTTAGLGYYLLRSLISLGEDIRFRNMRTAYGKWGFIRQILRPGA